MQNLDAMIAELPECTEELSLEQVYRMLSSSNDRMVAVVDSRSHRVPIGVITEQSICAQILGRKRDPRGLTAANVLDCKIKKVRRAHLSAAKELESAVKEKPVLVVDRDRRLIGLLKSESRWDGRIAVPTQIRFNDAAFTHPASAIMGLA